MTNRILRRVRATKLLGVILGIGSIFAVQAAGPWTVNTASDTHAANAAVSPNDGAGHISLRSALEAANAQSGATTITVPDPNTVANSPSSDHTYQLTLGELAVAPSGGKTITIQGAGAATTIVRQTDGNNRVFDIDINSVGGANVTVTGLTVTGGHDHADTLGGAGILAGSVTATPLDNLTLQDCTITDNHCSAPNATYTGQPGGGVNMQGGNLIVVHCTFSNNSSAASQGGAIAMFAPNLVGGGSGGDLTVSGSTFSNNSMLNNTSSGPDGGGAIYITTTSVSTHTITTSFFSDNSVNGSSSGATFGGAILLETGTLSIDHSSFTGNSASGSGGQGGLMYVQAGTASVSLSRLVDNTASVKGNALSANSGTPITAEDNWWGVNAGPGANDAFNASITRWLQLRHVPSLATLAPGGSTLLTADLLGRNSGGPLAASSLTTLPAIPVPATTIFHNAVLGSLSAASTQFASGIATATFTAGALRGFAGADATLDHQTITASIGIPVSVLSLNRVTATPSNLGTVQWTLTLDGAVSGVNTANFTVVNTGLGGTPAVSGASPVGAAPATTWTISASTGSGMGTLGLNMVNGTGVSAPFLNLPFDGETYTIDLVPPTVAISVPSATTTVTGPVSYTVTYTDANFGSSSLSPSDITLNATETASGSVGVSGSGNTRTVTISSIAGHGTLGISLAANTAVDLAGNTAPAAGPSTTFIVNHPPVANPDTITRYPTEAVKVLAATLLANDTDADGDVLSLTALQPPSSGHATVALKGSWVIYTPNPGFTSADSFTYTVSDTRGGTTTGTVTVNLVTDNASSQNELSIVNLGGGTFRITFDGIPGRTYSIQYTTDLNNPNWQTLGTATANALGVFSFDDPAGSVSRFYRSTYP